MLDLAALTTYFAQQPVKRAWLFGSFAEEQAGPESDVDILLELDHSQPVGLRFVRMWRELQEICQRDVDLLSIGGVSPHLWKHIEKQRKLIYEKSEICRQGTYPTHPRCH
jgi:predicted nucleotidyltransferase